MTASTFSANDARAIGNWRGVEIAVAPRDAVTAQVEIAAAGMFTHELAADGPAGGLLDLDTAMGGAVTRLRSDGIFRAAPGEVLALSHVVPPVKASTVLLVGMGDPAAWEATTLHGAVSAAAAEVLRRDAASACFAPSLLDSGIHTVDPDAVAAQMLGGLLRGLAASPDTSLNVWIFCTGLAHIESTRAAFAKAFAALPSA
ncbi:hypothetical protein AWL63_15495 [Sphingomonas panacis]|uniref:Peptidase M17 leucyl aminopeptidase N-terminal domain-containing protein n=1 Tax=Sphingomonas panacis TaxID=1560345 RepID=A0A1B3ZCK0_9SPHN|nr:M17 family peptidase N-terminal domain-containing protein [Sphingomonas panacis]AOH85154.1 hypothetical protein AWL63_15495 [Sphingomonas panacis]